MFELNTFNNIIFLAIKQNHRIPLYGKKILDQHELLRKGIRWKIGDGKNIFFWLLAKPQQPHRSPSY